MYAKNPESQKTRPVQPDKPKQTRSQSDSWKIYGGGLLLAALAFFITFQFVEPAPPKTLTIATGNTDGAYHHYALAFREEFARYGIDLDIRTSAGSLENLQLLSDPEANVQIAFVQSGLPKPAASEDLLGLGSVYLEPVWLFSRVPVPSGKLKDLAGRRLAIGEAGSGTREIALQILQDNQLTDSIEQLPLGGQQAIQALSTGQIDALLTVASEKSAVVQNLMNRPDISLVSWSRAEAYAQRYPFLSRVNLPEGSLDLARNIPDRNYQLVAPAATLVARDDLHPALSDLTMQIAAKIFSERSLFSQEGQFPSVEFLDYPLSPEAARFYKSGPPFLQRYLPFWAATLVDRLKVLLLPLIALMLPLSKILPPTYRWTVRKKIFQWYDELQLVDQSATEIPSEENLELCLANLDKIEKEVKAVEVPLGYAHELYVLRQHIDLLARQISVREQILEKQRLAQT
ncbi:MAG: TAXI family TRAP transporter solute-binding subunit [Gammaproteobacteria bacterium]|nr:TAXI family TRAP transporter solute-binding subunit [Gammaproteobacteria bacterium]